MNNFQKVWNLLNQKYKKQLYSFYILAAIFIIFTIAWDIFSAKLIIKIAPISSKITINNQPIKNGKLKLLPGKYKIKAEKPDFKSKEVEVDINLNQTKHIEFFLPQANSKTDWYLRNNEDDVIKTSIGSRNFTNKDQQLYRDNPILNLIPAGDPSISGSYRIDPEISLDDNGKEKVSSIIITVNDCRNRKNYDPFEFQKSAALKWLQQNGVKLNDYNLKYINNCAINR